MAGKYNPGTSQAVARLLDFHQKRGRTLDVWKFNGSEDPAAPTIGIVIVTTNPIWVEALENLTDAQVKLQSANAGKPQPAKTPEESAKDIMKGSTPGTEGA